jgi:hypothetical protein
VLYGVGGGEDLEPVLKVAELGEDVIINIDLKAKYFALLKLWLQIRIVASRLAVFIAA